MSGPLLDDEGNIIDIEADIVVIFHTLQTTLLGTEYPLSKPSGGPGGNYAVGEDLDELLKKEVDVRLYNNATELARLQALEHSLKLMQERNMFLKKDLADQEKKIKQLNDIHLRNEKRVTKFNRNNKAGYSKK